MVLRETEIGGRRQSYSDLSDFNLQDLNSFNGLKIFMFAHQKENILFFIKL